MVPFRDATSTRAAVSLCVLCLQAGWNKLQCTACGTGVLTDVAATNGLGLSADQCVIPPGWGSQIDANGKLVARQCVHGKYGASQQIYGIQPRPCQVGLQRSWALSVALDPGAFDAVWLPAFHQG